MIILDGPDCGGKSTFINELKIKGYSVIKPYYPLKNQLKYYLLSGPLYQGRWLERYYPSEMVYPRVKAERTPMEIYKQFIIEASLMPFHPTIIYLRPPLENIISNIKKRGDHYINSDEVSKLVHEYDKFMNRSKLDIIAYDYTLDTVEDIIDVIKDKPDKKINSLIAGNPELTDNIMFVGEKPSDKSIGEGFIRPFISNTGSSIFLHECLYEAGLYSEGYDMPYFTNFFKFSSHEVEAKEINSGTLSKEIYDMKPRKIICLGNDTYNNVKKVIESFTAIMDFELIKIQHPSYIKRFGGKKEYIKEIKQAII